MMRALIFTVISTLVACGGSEQAAVVDARDDASDAPPGGDACPPHQPSDDAGCDATMSCTYPDRECASTFTSTCSGVWSSTPPVCGPMCPEREPSGTCNHPDGYVCWYWPTPTRDTCHSCSCVSGVWSCTAATCAFPFEGCADGKSCSGIGVGCGTGKCSQYCKCGVDHVFHCLAHPC